MNINKVLHYENRARLFGVLVAPTSLKSRTVEDASNVGLPCCQAYCVRCFGGTRAILSTPSAQSREPNLKSRGAGRFWCTMFTVNLEPPAGGVGAYIRAPQATVYSAWRGPQGRG